MKRDRRSTQPCASSAFVEMYMNPYLYSTISEVIEREFSILPHLKGCGYLKEAVLLVLQDPIQPIMPILQNIAATHNCSCPSIERAIRYAIDKTYVQNHLNQHFSSTQGKPSNSELIYLAADTVKKRCRDSA